MIPLSEIELNGLKYNDCIDIILLNGISGYNRFFFAGFDTCVLIKGDIEERMIVNLIITPTKAITGIQTKPLRIPIEKIQTIVINE